MPASTVTERPATTRGGHRSGTRPAGSVDGFALNASRCVSLMWPEESEPEQILCTHSQPSGDCAGVRETGRRLLVDALLGRVVEDLLPGPSMASWLAGAVPEGQEEFALAGMADAWRRLAAWATAGELAVIAEMAARAAARDGSVDMGPDGRPGQVPEGAVAEVGLALRMSRFGAEMWTDLAVTLTWRLPRTLAALSGGAIDLSRARLIAEATSVLDDSGAMAVEDKVLADAGGQTLGQLRAVLRRAVISVDPAAAERRREEAERRASVGLYGDPEGTATLAGHNLPGGQAAAALARVTALAQAMKAAGAAGGIDLLRAQVFVGLLLNTLPLIPPPQEDPGAPGPPEPGTGGPPDEHPDDGGPQGGGHPPAGDAHRRGDDGRFPPGGNPARRQDQSPTDHRTRTDRDTTADSATPPPWPGLPAQGEVPSSGCPPGRPGRMTLTVPWQTLAGVSSEPGMLCWLGPVTPLVSRQIAETGAGDPRTEWRVIVTSSSGEFIYVARIRRQGRSRAGPQQAMAGRPRLGGRATPG